MRRWHLPSLFSICLLAGAGLLLVAATNAVPPYRVQPPMPADTLTATIEAGQLLIVALPDSLGGHPVADYRDLQLPAFSLRHGRSFFWQTALADVGRHYCAFVAASEGAPRDTLILSVQVTAP